MWSGARDGRLGVRSDGGTEDELEPRRRLRRAGDVTAWDCLRRYRSDPGGRGSDPTFHFLPVSLIVSPRSRV